MKAAKGFSKNRKKSRRLSLLGTAPRSKGNSNDSALTGTVTSAETSAEDLKLRTAKAPNFLSDQQLYMFSNLMTYSVTEKEVGVPSEVVLLNIGVAVGFFDDFREVNQETREKNEGEEESVEKEMIFRRSCLEKSLRRYIVLLVSDCPLRKSFKFILDSLESDEIISRIDLTDCFVLSTAMKKAISTEPEQ